MKVLFVACLVSICATQLCAQQDLTITITSGGLQRTCQVHLPSATPAAGRPVLLCYHGTGGSGSGMIGVTGFNTLANANNFIVVYPQSATIGGTLQWNVYIDDKPGHGGVSDNNAPDDIQFTRDIVDYLSAQYAIDRSRVFATGLSNGGFMCYALSMLTPNLIKAIAPVAANMWGDDVYVTQLVTSGSVAPMPVMHVHGTADGVVSYPDPDNTPMDYQEYPLFISSRVCNKVTYSQVLPVSAGVDKLVFCGAPIEVSLIRVTGMGHSWSNGTYQTSTEIVKFFGLQGSSQVPSTPVEASFTVAPNPIDARIELMLATPASVSIIDAMGNTVYKLDHASGASTISAHSFPSGVYNVVVHGTDLRASKSKSIVIVH